MTESAEGSLGRGIDDVLPLFNLTPLYVTII